MWVIVGVGVVVGVGVGVAVFLHLLDTLNTSRYTTMLTYFENFWCVFSINFGFIYFFFLH